MNAAPAWPRGAQVDWCTPEVQVVPWQQSPSASQVESAPHTVDGPCQIAPSSSHQLPGITAQLVVVAEQHAPTGWGHVIAAHVEPAP
jgi:hypothetical protein